jgi:tetratricopeptide (TPR) repeat protein
VAPAQPGKEKHPFGLCWFFIAYLITSNVFFPIGTVFGERLAYLPSLGIAIWLAELLLGVAPQLLARAAAWGLVGVYGLGTAVHSPVWRDNPTLYRYQIGVSACSAKTEANYAMVLQEEGDLKAAHEHLIESLEIYPNYDVAAFGLGSLFALQGVESRAEMWLARALEINPDHIAARRLLGQVYVADQQYVLAAEEFEELTRRYPLRPDGLLGQIDLELAKHRTDEAKRLLRRVEIKFPEAPELSEYRKKVQAQ